MMFRKCDTPNLSIDGKERYISFLEMQKFLTKKLFRFKSMLITAKAPRLRMNFVNDVSFLDAAFLTAYSEAIALADLSIYGENVRWLTTFQNKIIIAFQTPLFYPDPSFAETLAKFGDFTWCCMVVNTDWILASIQVALPNLLSFWFQSRINVLNILNLF